MDQQRARLSWKEVLVQGNRGCFLDRRRIGWGVCFAREQEARLHLGDACERPSLTRLFPESIMLTRASLSTSHIAKVFQGHVRPVKGTGVKA
jgi:hypothetical protein